MDKVFCNNCHYFRKSGYYNGYNEWCHKKLKPIITLHKHTPYKDKYSTEKTIYVKPEEENKENKCQYYIEKYWGSNLLEEWITNSFLFWFIIPFVCVYVSYHIIKDKLKELKE